MIAGAGRRTVAAGARKSSGGYSNRDEEMGPPAKVTMHRRYVFDRAMREAEEAARRLQRQRGPSMATIEALDGKPVSH